MTEPTEPARARCGWESNFPTFSTTEPHVIRIDLEGFLAGVSESQVFAWNDSIPKLQHEVNEVVVLDDRSSAYSAILEYELPLESRRPDVILLVSGAIVVLELKGKVDAEQADLDQAAAYARDLRCYHKHCAGREVHAVVVPTRAHGYVATRDGVRICGPDGLHELIQQMQRPWADGPLTADEFLSRDAYCPLPSLVKAARELFDDGHLRDIPEARACTDPAVETIARIAHEAARTHSRHLVLVTGVPGSGKTMVGLRAVHNPGLDDLSIERVGGKPPSSAIFLSGNGPLVEVLQYELSGAGGGGKTFVRDVKNYVKQYLGDKSAVPPQHVIVYDEAQRAWDVDQVAAKHAFATPMSEPEAFVEFGERIPEWCVLVGLIGSGQEIHVGEEAGLGQWRQALASAGRPGGWTVHAPQPVLDEFFAGRKNDGSEPNWQLEGLAELDLQVEIRFHFASDLDEWVETLLQEGASTHARRLAESLERQNYHLRMTRNLEQARGYFAKRFDGEPNARYGLIASSRDKSLHGFGIWNDFQSTKRLRLGPWYGDGDESALSCRHLRDCITEFQAQGLELDGVLLGWGTDFMREAGAWSDDRARHYKPGTHVLDPFQLRLNAYRVMLTRGRNGTVIYVPPLAELNETAAWLQECGVRVLDA